MVRKRSKDVDEYDISPPTKNWWPTARGANFAEWMAVENGEVTDKRLQLSCERNIHDKIVKCTVSRYRYLKAFPSPKKAIAYAKSYMRKHKT